MLITQGARKFLLHFELIFTATNSIAFGEYLLMHWSYIHKLKHYFVQNSRSHFYNYHNIIHCVWMGVSSTIYDTRGMLLAFLK